eukprot:GHVN01043640.1.p1 GENE.GHVN01043640.1~~GHVN01043640.1.p1  ORF type:complete len:410 (+),score=31.37 GHVN01043640.1:101-1330(+)
MLLGTILKVLVGTLQVARTLDTLTAKKFVLLTTTATANVPGWNGLQQPEISAKPLPLLGYKLYVNDIEIARALKYPAILVRFFPKGKSPLRSPYMELAGNAKIAPRVFSLTEEFSMEEYRHGELIPFKDLKLTSSMTEMAVKLARVHDLYRRIKGQNQANRGTMQLLASTRTRLLTEMQGFQMPGDPNSDTNIATNDRFEALVQNVVRYIDEIPTIITTRNTSHALDVVLCHGNPVRFLRPSTLNTTTQLPDDLPKYEATPKGPKHYRLIEFENAALDYAGFDFAKYFIHMNSNSTSAPEVNSVNWEIFAQDQNYTQMRNRQAWMISVYLSSKLNEAVYPFDAKVDAFLNVTDILKLPVLLLTISLRLLTACTVSEEDRFMEEYQAAENSFKKFKKWFSFTGQRYGIHL